MDRRGWAGEIIDLVYFHIEWEGNVMPDDFEVLMVEQMLDITARTGEEVVDAEDNSSVREQALAKVRAEEASTAGNQDSLFDVHLISPEVLV